VNLKKCMILMTESRFYEMLKCFFSNLCFHFLSFEIAIFFKLHVLEPLNPTDT
jgi:hypothetical protein